MKTNLILFAVVVCGVLLITCATGKVGAADMQTTSRLGKRPVHGQTAAAQPGAGPVVMRTIAGGSRTFELVDVQAVSVDQPERGVKTFVLDRKPRTGKFDIVIAGGGVGGVAAALRALEFGATVCLTEETDWLGGQMTAQGVSAPDENRFIETTGGTLSYQRLRSAIREHYQSLAGGEPRLSGNQRLYSESGLLNPGNCWVSWLSFEPQVALAKLDELLRPYLNSGRLTVLPRTKVVKAKIKSGRLRSLTAFDLDTGKPIALQCKFCLDATELGDLLPLAGIAYRSGAESATQTGEAHAPLNENPENVQDFTYPFVVEWRPGEDHTIDKPPHYDEFKMQGKFSFGSFRMFESVKKTAPSGERYEFEPFWTYRRLIAKENFPRAKQWQHDLSMINWESNDVRGQNLIDQTPFDVAARLALGKAISLGFLHWLQTEAPRDDGGKGYPELRLRPDVLGTADGCSKYPYIRESRRLQAKYTIVESDIAAATNSGARARLFTDSVGIGHYAIDIHGHQDVPGAGQPARPFQIPLSALVQGRVRNFLPACKNIGTTHITNGAYRLHPVEWATGEAAGMVAAYCIKHKTTPERILKNRRRLRTIQKNLVDGGAPVFWFSDVPTTHPCFAAIQFLAVAGIWPVEPGTLKLRPDRPISYAEAATVLQRILRLPVPEEAAADSVSGAALDACIAGKLLPDESRQQSAEPLPAEALSSLSTKFSIPVQNQAQLVSRCQFSLWAYQLATRPAHFGRR